MPQGHGPEAPRTLGRYELVVEVAKGQLGALWLAHVGAELFAIRRVPTGPPMERPDVDRMSEAAWWSLDVRHENVAAVLDVVMTEGELGVVTRYVPGELLRSLLRLSSFKRKPVASPIAMRIAADILGGLVAAHEQAQPASGVNLGSGGVNPDAVLIGSADGRATLLDIGIASVASSITILSQHPELGAYSAPEQLDQTKAPDPRSDVFSLGVLLWEMISSRRLFAGSSQAVIREKLEACAVPRLDANKPVGGESISTAVADLVARALARDPADRYESAAAMADAIRDLGSDMIADRSAVAGLVEELAGQALATRSKALKRATMPQKAQVPGPRPQLPTLVGIAPDAPAPAANAPAPAPAPAKPLADLATVAADLARAPAVTAEPAVPPSEPTPEPPTTRAEEPATPEAEEPAVTKQAAVEPAQASLPQQDESVDVDVATAADPPVSEPEPTTIRRASAPEDVFANVKADPGPISERELVDALTRESNPGPPPLESIDFTAHGSEPRIAPGKPAPTALAPPAPKPAAAAAPAPKYVVPLTASAAPAPAAPAAAAPAVAAVPAPSAAELVAAPERPRAPMISDFEGPPSQEQIARTQKARKVVAGVVAGLGLLLVIGLMVTAFKSEDSGTTPATTDAYKPRTTQAAQPAEPAAHPEPHASIAAKDRLEEREEKAEPAEKTEPAEKAEPAEKTEPVEKTEPAEKTEPQKQADSPAPVSKPKATVTKPRSTARSTSKTAPASAPRPATKPKSKKPKYVPSGI